MVCTGFNYRGHTSFFRTICLIVITNSNVKTQAINQHQVPATNGFTVTSRIVEERGIPSLSAIFHDLATDSLRFITEPHSERAQIIN